MSGTAAAIAILRVAYPGEFGDETVAFYARKLADLEPAEVVGAVDRLTNRMRFRPTVADIRLEVAEASLRLPSVVEAWQIVVDGDLRDAPACVREACDYVGGRYSIMVSENPSTIRAQFRQAYERTREQALLVAAGASAPRSLSPATRPALPAADPDETFVPMPAVLRRQLLLDIGHELGPPTDEEKANAIEVLRAGTDVEPANDMLYRAAERVMVDATEALDG